MSFAKAFRSACVGAALVASGLLSGCTLTPVYSEAAMASQNLALTYAEPDTRLEQLVYRTLSGRLGPTGLGAPQFSARVSSTTTRIGLSNVGGPVGDSQVAVAVTYQVIQNGTSIANGTRTATIGYRTTGQIVADDAARTTAEEQAVISATESVRLALLASLQAQ